MQPEIFMSAFHDIYNVSRLSKNISQPEKFNDIPCWLWMRIEKNAEKIKAGGFQGREKLALGWEKDMNDYRTVVSFSSNGFE